MCSDIAQGRALDLIEIDAASNRGIDEIRSLREKVGFAPNTARRKVYIIDEVHMLTAPAFNALLKTLEEPPPHTVIVLATTESHKLPATIISRCQRFDLRRISRADVVRRLAQICESESAEATEGALGLVARSAGGSLRDAENILEQLVVGVGGAIDEEAVRAALGIGGPRADAGAGPRRDRTRPWEGARRSRRGRRRWIRPRPVPPRAASPTCGGLCCSRPRPPPSTTSPPRNRRRPRGCSGPPDSTASWPSCGPSARPTSRTPPR